jgi:ubiquinone/menaquinone biosynthesis C-methylase UbiE
MTSPFDAIAPVYDRLWNRTPRGGSQRALVWKELGRVFSAGDFVLDLGCGTGDDAAFLSDHGVRVLGIDSSSEMIRVAQARGIPAHRAAIEELHALDGPYSGALSNFGALNCVADLHQVAGQLGRLLLPGSFLVICLMGRLCWPEILMGNFRRIRGRARWRGMNIYYPSVRQVCSAFAPCFTLERQRSLGGGDHRLYTLRRRSEC